MKEVTIVADTQCREKRVAFLLIVGNNVTVDKNMDRAGSAITGEIINLPHREKLNLFVFKEMIKKSADCQAVTQDVIDRCKNC